MAANPDCTYHVVGTQRDDHAQYARTDGTRAFTGAIAAPAVAASLSASGRYVGSTNGSPTGGPYLAGDFANDPTLRTFWECTVGGSPGTWVAVPGQTDANWTTASPLTNSWASTGGIGFILLGQVVYLRGVFTTGGTAGQSAFTLPVGYRPSTSQSYIVSANSGVTLNLVTVANTGTVTPQNSTQTWVAGISFPVV